MDNWRQDKCTEINKALERIEKRADRVSRMISASSSAHNQEDQPQQQQQQQQQQVSTLTNELARLQDMNDRLFDFRDRLCFYSNLGYVEALNEWQYEIRKICVKAEGFVYYQQRRDPHPRHRHRRHHSSGDKHSSSSKQPTLVEVRSK